MQFTVKKAIEEDLGYCCTWVFLTKFKRTSMIARRLGFDPRTIRLWKAKVKSGELACTNCSTCMKKVILKRY